MANPAMAPVGAVTAQPPPPTGGWEHFAHGKDIGVRGSGSHLEEAFEQAALALAAVVTDAPVEPRIAVTVVCEAADSDRLLAEWLDAVIYEMDARHMVFGRFSVTIRGRRLYGTAWGEMIHDRHSDVRIPKAATLTESRVLRDKGGRWVAGCVIDA